MANKATAYRQYEKGEDSERSPKIPYLKGKSQEPATSVHHRHRHARVDDSQSWGTMSISDSKSHFTTFSGPRRKTTIHSTTTPSTSRPSSPTRIFPPSRKDMEHDLVGIGSQARSSPLGVFGDSIPIRSRCTELPERGMSQQEIETPRDGNDERRTVVYEGREASDSESDSQDFDLDLERSANIALATCFGVSLNRLSWPIRVLEAFSGFKDRCVDILKDEECLTTIDWDDDGFSCFDVEESPECYNEEGYNRTSNHPQQAQSRASKRPADDDDNYNGPDEAEAYPHRNPATKTRRLSKKICVPQNLSCPFRTRNPIRFNVRDHFGCAGRSYDNMTKLKIHLRSDHLIKSCRHCKQKFDNLRGPTLSDHTPAVCIGHMQLLIGANAQQVEVDPEDGMDGSLEYLLQSRARDSRIEDWASLYRMLFPSDQVVPSSDFKHVVEHHEVAYDGYNGCVAKTTDDLVDLFRRRPELAAQAEVNSHARKLISEAVHNNLKTLLKDSIYAVYGVPAAPRYLHQRPAPKRDNMGESSDSSNTSPDLVITPQASPPGASRESTNRPRNSEAVVSNLGPRPIAPRQPQPNTSTMPVGAFTSFDFTLPHGSSSFGETYQRSETDLTQPWQPSSLSGSIDLQSWDLTNLGSFMIGGAQDDTASDLPMSFSDQDFCSDTILDGNPGHRWSFQSPQEDV